MSRSGESVTRLDIRFPNEMYQKLQQIAVRDGARTHHISQKVEVSPTVIKLLQFSLDIIAERLSDSSDNISDILSAMATTILSDKTGHLSDNVPDTQSSTMSDKSATVSDISDKRIESIVDKRLTELGLFPTSQSPKTLIDDNCLSDNSDIVPDTLSDNNVIISDKGALLPDNLPDTENIPSDDSECVAKCDAVELGGEVPQSFSFGEFYDWLGLTRAARNKANGDIAIDFARSQGRGEWVMSKSYKITKQSENN
jgi:hypothetical protein